MNIGSLKILIKFSNEYLFEDVSSTYLAVNSDEVSPSDAVGGGIPTILPGGAGYVMKDDQYLLGAGIGNNGYNVGITNQMTVGFWLYPINHGLATSSGGVVESISMPLLTLTDSSTYSQIITIREHTSENSENYLTVDFNSSDLVLTSSNYDSDLWHFVMLSCDRVRGSFSISIDGKDESISKIGNLFTTVSAVHMDLYVNFSHEGYAYNMAKNYGYIDDIFVMNEIISHRDMQTVINDGIDYLVNTNFNIKEVEGYSIYFNDPTTITINSIVDDMSYVYIGRNDGKILRGSPLFWESRKVYADENEADMLGLTEKELVDNKVEDGFLKLKNTTIRL